jgi:hypothetical protein
MHLRPIGLIGKARSGKDTVAEYLEGYGYFKVAFADDMKEFAREIFPWRFKEGKDRKLLQQFGEKMREIDPDVWVRRLFGKLDYLMSRGAVLPVITDLRMPNEYAACRERGFVIIRVDAEANLRRRRMIDNGDVFREEDLNHETEGFVEGFVAPSR